MESNIENHRVRKIILYYYLEDGSMHAAEPKQDNSGMPQVRDESAASEVSQVSHMCTQMCKHTNDTHTYTRKHTRRHTRRRVNACICACTHACTAYTLTLASNASNTRTPQGTFIKRHVFIKDDGVSAFTPADFSVGDCTTIYGRVFYLVDADGFTRQWFEDNMGTTLAAPLPYPDDPVDNYRMSFGLTKGAKGEWRGRA